MTENKFKYWLFGACAAALFMANLLPRWGLAQSELLSSVVEESISVGDSYLEKCARYRPREDAPNPYSLSLAERTAIYEYTSATFADIDKVLWNDGLESAKPCITSAVELLDSSMLKIPGETITLYRGSNSKLYPNLEDIPEIPLKGYTSTSIDEEVARNFLVDVFFIIRAHSAKPIWAYSAAQDGFFPEQEYLLPRGTKLRIDRTYRKSMIALRQHDAPFEVDALVVEATQL